LILAFASMKQYPREAIRLVLVSLFLGSSFLSPLAVASPPAAGNEPAADAGARRVAEAGRNAAPSAAENEEDAATRRLVRAVGRGSVRSVLSALEQGARIDENREAFVGVGLQTPLVSASLRGYDRVVRVLIENGADASVPEKDGFTVWHAAAFQGRTDVLVVLDELDVPGYGISPADGFTPLHRAAWGRTLRHVGAVEYLIGPSGRACDVVAKNGQTPLDVVKHERIKKLLEACLEAPMPATSVCEEAS